MRLKPKYRLLSTTELQALEKEFVQFLATHSITAKDWQTIKNTSRDKVDGLIILFSDQILEKILREVRLLEKRSHQRIELFNIHPQRIIMYALEVDNQPSGLWEHEDLMDLHTIWSGKIPSQIIRAEKKVQESPERETFNLMQGGAIISRNEKLYETLQNLYQSRQS